MLVACAHFSLSKYLRFRTS